MTQNDLSNDSDNIDKEELMKIEYNYPEPSDKNLQYKLYQKRELYYNKVAKRPNINDYNDIKDHRDNICAGEFTLNDHQALLSNFINPDTPYKGVLIYHGVGTGKTCTAIAIAEKFKQMVQKYNTKIVILVPGPLLKENWKMELLKCTGETYLKYIDKSIYIDEAEKIKQKKNALIQALQYYRFMSYRSFYKRVLGEKIIDKRVDKENGVKVSYRKNEEGEFERDVAIDRIYNLNNTLLIADEAHWLTGNAFGEAFDKIVKVSSNLKVLLLTATPMKNLADDIIELLNFIRPVDSPIEREKVFNSYKNHQMDFKDGGLEYLKNMARGYVSHMRGADPITYAKRLEMGILRKGLLFTKIIPCKMYPFQREVYNEVLKTSDDSLDRRSEAVSNFAFPALSDDRKKLIGLCGKDGIDKIKNQLKSHYSNLNKKIGIEIFDDNKETDYMYLTDDGRTLTGKFMEIDNLKHFSTKFYKALKNLNRLVWGQKGARTAFVYSNLVKVGIEIFEQILLQNGYLEYNTEGDYKIKSNTLCYYCGRIFKDHHLINSNKQQKRQVNRKQRGGNESEEGFEDASEELFEDVPKQNISSSDIERKKYKIVNIDYEYHDALNDSDAKFDEPMPTHEFFPATYLPVTGQSSEEAAEVVPEEKQKIITDVFNNVSNKEGRHIKFILGSKVMNEGISLRNVSEVHILDVYFNFARVEQVIGRAIRFCSHYKLMNENNVFPIVKVYKYAVVLDKEGDLSAEEDLYKKAELKYILIKKTERAIKEVAIDCPLNLYGNMFKEEMEEYAKCGEKGHMDCPAICDYTKCGYKCDDDKLNAEYYDPERHIYKTISKNKLDTTTFTKELARNEIDFAKKRIKELYLKNYVYTLEKILKYVKNSYSEEKKELFDNFFVFKALDELIPLTENDFNNYKDTILDKFNRQGYLIYNNGNYIFQPFDQNEDVPMYYRTTFDKEIPNQLSLYNYLKNSIEYNNLKGKITTDSEEILKQNVQVYDFDSVMDYYDNRDEFKYVGIIDKELSRRKSKQVEELNDVFKIREKRSKILDKKRGTGIPSLKGAVCSVAKDKGYLESLAKALDLKYEKNDTRISICDKIRDKMLYLEKYGTTKEGNKMTYVMIPANHPIYPFPYNLEDRIKLITDKIKKEITIKHNLNVNKDKKKDNIIYKITIDNSDKIDEYNDFFTILGFKKDKKEWILIVE
jgi:hypothetical protein